MPKLYYPEIPKCTHKPEPLARVQDTQSKPKKAKKYEKEKKLCIDMFKRGYSSSDIVAKIGLPHSYVDRWVKSQEKKDFKKFCKKMDIKDIEMVKAE